MLFSTLTEVSPHTGGMPGQQETQLKETGIKTMQAKSSASKKAHEIKNAAFAFGVYGNNSKRIADVAVTNSGLVWSNGKASKDVVVKWDAFINWMESQLSAPAAKKAPAKAKAKAKAKAAAPKAKAPVKSKAKKAAKSAANGAKRAAVKKAPAKAPVAAVSVSTVH